MRRCQDAINPSNHCDAMFHAPDDDESNGQHPYYYARILAIFHVWASRRPFRGHGPSTPPEKIDFLWVRWFRLDTTAPGGFITRRLHRVSFIDASHEDSGAFGFVDPASVIRSVHIVGAFAFGRTQDLLPPSIARLASEEESDWKYYYICM